MKYRGGLCTWELGSGYSKAAIAIRRMLKEYYILFLYRHAVKKKAALTLSFWQRRPQRRERFCRGFLIFGDRKPILFVKAPMFLTP